MTLKAGERESCEEKAFVWCDENAGNLEILAAMKGLVTKEMPRPCRKFEAVKTQKEVPLLKEHVGWISHGLVWRIIGS